MIKPNTRKSFSLIILFLSPMLFGFQMEVLGPISVMCRALTIKAQLPTLPLKYVETPFKQCFKNRFNQS